MDPLKCGGGGVGGGANESEEELLDSAAPSLTADCAIFDFVLYTVIGGSLCAFGVVGNSLSFVVLQPKDNAKSSATPFLLRALAVADSLVLMAVVPLYALPSVYPFTGYLEGYYELYHGIMPYLWPVYLMSYTGTILMTVLVSLERYLAVCKPVSSASLRSVEQSRRHALAVVVFAVLYNIPRFFEYHRVEKCSSGSENSTTKTIFELSAFGQNKLYRILYANILYFVVMLGGPLLSLAFFNVKLITALKAQRKRRQEMTLSGRGQLQQDLTLVLVVVIFAFSLCQTPTFVDHILWTIVSKTETSCGNWHYYYTAIADTLAILNSSINFIIYVLTSTKFRHGLVRLFGGGRRSRIRESERTEGPPSRHRLDAASAATPAAAAPATDHRLTEVDGVVCPCSEESGFNRLFGSVDQHV